MNGKKLKKALKVLNIKQTEFADLFGLSHRTVRHYVDPYGRGITYPPTEILINLWLLRKISRSDIEAAKVPISYKNLLASHETGGDQH